jgi:rhamnogalacturonan endolyase
MERKSYFLHLATVVWLTCRAVFNVAVLTLIASSGFAFGNLPGGGTGTGPDVTAKSDPDGTITLDNGIATVVIHPASASIASLLYTHTRNGAVKQEYVIEPRSAGLYWGTYTGNGKYTHDLANDHLSPDRCDVVLRSDATGTRGIMEVHYSMLRGSPGFYATAVLVHSPADGSIPPAPFGASSLLAPIFNWTSVDSARNYFIGTETNGFVGAADAAKEIGINKSGTQVGQFADKFFSGQDHGDLTAWGWSSVGRGGANIGVWFMNNMEFSDGGPLKRDITVFPFANRRYMNNSLLTTEIGQGSDGGFFQGEKETWSKVCGPFFCYLNSTTDNTSPSHTAQTLYQDALAQAKAEAGAWPYKWFADPNYIQGADRGTVTGKIAVHDTSQPLAECGSALKLNRSPLPKPMIFSSGFGPISFGRGPITMAILPSLTSFREQSTLSMPSGPEVPVHSCPINRREVILRGPTAFRPRLFL